MGFFFDLMLEFKLGGTGLGGIEQGAEGGRSSRRMRECEANYPEEWSVKISTDVEISGGTLE